MFQRLRKWMQFDATLVYALTARLWQILAGPITLGLILHAFTLPQQGIYYTFVGLATLQNLFELGYLNLLISRVGRATGNSLSAIAESSSTNESTYRELAGHLHVARNWFALIACLFFFFALSIGFFILRKTEVPLRWQEPLIAYVASSACIFYLTHRIAFLEGAGARASVYRLYLFQSILGSAAVWSGLIFGFKLWALVFASLVQLGMTSFFTLFRPPAIMGRLQNLAPDREIRDRNANRAGQWRTAAYSLVQFAANQFFVLLVMQFHGEEEAGRMGISLMAVNAVQTVALAWMQTKYALFATQHGSGQQDAALRLWRQALMISLVILAILLFDLLVGLFIVAYFFPNYQNRFIAPAELIVLSIGILANHIVASLTLFVMSRRSTPLTRAALIGFSTTAIGVALGALWFKNLGAVAGYSLGMACVALPLQWVAYRRMVYDFTRRSAESTSEPSD
jgi:hypothetical protein